MAHEIWKDNINLMLNGCHDCWTYKVIKFAFETNLIEVCNISFNEDRILEYMNTLYENKILLLLEFVQKQHLVKQCFFLVIYYQW